ncbi:polysaccharide deacetylase family protein [Candidatus Omnitrophota bacterium]
MKATLKIYELLSRVIGPVAAQRANLRVLMYHRIQSEPQGYAYLHPNDFVDHMAYLKDSGYTTCTMAHLHENWAEVLSRPKSIVLTFDDVWTSQVETVLPALKQHGFVGTFFVPTAHIENKRHKPRFSDLTLFDAELCCWGDVEILQNEGMEIGAHSHTHKMLTKLSLDQVREEISISSQILREHCTERVVSFCYPFGKRKTFNPEIMKIISEHDFKIACSTIWGCVTYKSNLLALPRIGIHGTDQLDSFKRKMNGWHDYKRWIHRFR